MILFSATSGVVLSDIRGYAGNCELRAFAKKLKVRPADFKSPGHPALEHFTAPASKIGSLPGLGATAVETHILLAAQARKERA